MCDDREDCTGLCLRLTAKFARAVVDGSARIRGIAVRVSRAALLEFGHAFHVPCAAVLAFPAFVDGNFPRSTRRKLAAHADRPNLNREAESGHRAEPDGGAREIQARAHAVRLRASDRRANGRWSASWWKPARIWNPFTGGRAIPKAWSCTSRWPQAARRKTSRCAGFCGSTAAALT